MRSIIKKFIVFGTVVFMLLTIYDSIYQTFIDNNSNDINNIVELTRINNSDNLITFENMKNINNTQLGKMTAYSELIGDVSNKFGFGEEKIKIVLIHEKYMSVYKKNMVAGLFPGSYETGQDYVAVSDCLSSKLFKSIDTIGNEVWILNRKYKVRGIYKRSDSMLINLLGDGFDRVFIPYESVKDNQNRPVDVLTVRRDKGEALYDIESKLKADFGDKLAGYKITDYSNIYNGLGLGNNLLLFFLGLIAIIYTIFFMIKYLLLLIQKLKLQGDYYYINSILRVEFKKIISVFLIIIICSFVIVYIINLIRFNFYINKDYIPDDNIFDLKFYFEQLLMDIKEKNMSNSSVYSYLKYTYHNALFLNIIINVFMLIFVIVSASFLKLLKTGGVAFKKLILYILIIMVAGSLIGVVFSSAFGLKIAFPVKATTLITYFFFISGSLHKNNEFPFLGNSKN